MPRARLAAVLFFVACSDGTSPTPVARIEVTPAYSLLPVGSSRQLSAVAYGQDGAVIGSGGGVKWESSDSAAVSVDESGLVRALRPGGSFIRASVEAASDQAIVEVPITGTWALTTVNGLRVPVTLDPNASCAPMGVAGSGAFTVDSGRLVFAGSRVHLQFVRRQRCGAGEFRSEGWPDIGYLVNGSQITFLTGGADPSFARIFGTIDGTRIVVQMPTKTAGTLEAVFAR